MKSIYFSLGQGLCGWPCLDSWLVLWAVCPQLRPPTSLSCVSIYLFNQVSHIILAVKSGWAWFWPAMTRVPVLLAGLSLADRSWHCDFLGSVVVVGGVCLWRTLCPLRCPQVWLKGSRCAAELGTCLWVTWSLLQKPNWKVPGPKGGAHCQPRAKVLWGGSQMGSWKPGVRSKLFRLNCDWPGENRTREGEVTSQGQSQPSWRWLMALGVSTPFHLRLCEWLAHSLRANHSGLELPACREDNDIWAAQS